MPKNAKPCRTHPGCVVIFRPRRKRPDGTIEHASKYRKRVFCIHLRAE